MTLFKFTDLALGPTLYSTPVISTGHENWVTSPIRGPSGVVVDSDKIHRVMTSTSTSIATVYSWDTNEVQTVLMAWRLEYQQDIDALKQVTKAQRKHIDYQAVYSAFLIGAISEDEFEQESETYVAEERFVPVEILAPIVSRVNRLLDFEISNNELAEYLEVDSDSISAALQLLEDSPEVANGVAMHSLLQGNV